MSVSVATCDIEIAKYAESIGVRAIMTSSSHETASDRTAEAVETLEREGVSINVVAMIQGDEPLVTPEMIDAAVQPVASGAARVTNLMTSIDAKDALDPNEIKVVVDHENNALYMSRLPIPYHRGQATSTHWKQVCVIPFERSLLTEFNALPRPWVEKVESIDMLRLIDLRVPVHMVPVPGPIQSVDNEHDRERAERLLSVDPLARSYS